MKTAYRYIVLLLLVALWLQATAQDHAEAHDTLYVYQSWESILDSQPDQVFYDPYIEAVTPYEIYIVMDTEVANYVLLNETVAVALGDSIWLINSQWLNSNFEGDCRNMKLWVPLYFTAKLAFMEWIGTNFFGIPEEEADIYYIDFARERVDKLDHKTLTALLERYPDLQRRYVAMKDYKKRHVIRFYFFEYLERVNADPTVPWIVE